MAPIKFEENIREKLQERELQPSKEAWKKLASQLANEPEKKNNKALWYSIAASLVGILLVVTFLFQTEDESTNTQLVSEDVVLPEDTEVLTNRQTLETVAVDELQEATAVAKEVSESNGTTNLNNRKTNNAMAEATNEKPIIVQNGTPNSEENITNLKPGDDKKGVIAAIDSEKVKKEAPPLSKDDRFFDSKVNEVVASIQDIQKENKTITVEDIDLLLARAQRDIATNRILNSGNQKIDATALLQDVETELERSFRDKVFDALGEGFNKVRTAVAERNN